MQTFHINRRDFLAGLGSTVGWPSLALAEDAERPVIGFLNSASPRAFGPLVAAFREGLAARGFVDGRNVLLDYRWAEGHYEKLPIMANELVRRQVSVIAATGGVVSAQAAKNATTTIPIVFVVGFDPVQLGLIDSLGKPGGNATGVSVFTTELAKKRLELLHNLLPEIQSAAILVNAASVATDIEVRDTILAAQTFGLKLQLLEAASDSELEAAFAAAAERRTSALLVSADPFFSSRRDKIVALAARHMLPTMYPLRGYTEAGGLVSYGTKLSWAYQQVGDYAGRILKGAKTTELPAQLPTNFEFILNLKTAKALGITVSPWLLARVHEVIE